MSMLFKYKRRNFNNEFLGYLPMLAGNEKVGNLLEVLFVSGVIGTKELASVLELDSIEVKK